MEASPLLFSGPAEAPVTLVLAHGAGAAMDSPFMNAMAAGLALHGVRVARFEFPYMAARRKGRRPGPDRPAVLLATWRTVVAGLGGGDRVAIGGKSMGGRIASMVADELGVRALVCLGYPFHAPGREPGDRIAHLQAMKTPTLILHGTRDSFGSPDEIAEYCLTSSIELHWIPDGDHDFKPRASSGRTQRQNWDEAVEAIARFLRLVGV